MPTDEEILAYFHSRNAAHLRRLSSRPLADLAAARLAALDVDRKFNVEISEVIDRVVSEGAQS